VKSTRSSERAWFLAILAGAFALRVVAIGRDDLRTDEIQTLHAVRLDVGAMVGERLRAGHVPLYFLIEKAWCSLFGTSQFALRLPSALFGVALLVPARSLFRRLSGEKAAWAGVALVAAHPLFIELSREARMYSLLGLVAFVVADRVVATLDGERPGASFWIAAALGPFIHPTWGVAMLPLLAWFALERRGASPESKKTSRAASLGLVASLALLVVALVFAQPQHQELTRRPWPREIGVFVLRIFAGSDLRLFHSILACVGIGVTWAPFVLGGLADAAPRARRFALCWAAGVPAISVAAGVVGGVPWGPARYVEMAAAGFVLLAAVRAASLAGQRNFSAIVLLVVVLVTAVGPLVSRSTAWSDAAMRMRDDPSPVVVPDEPSRIVLAHYLGRDVFVGRRPSGAETWQRASLDSEDGRRDVRIEVDHAPR
jgi:uncharacterized membrane protein